MYLFSMILDNDDLNDILVSQFNLRINITGKTIKTESFFILKIRTAFIVFQVTINCNETSTENQFLNFSLTLI